MASLYNRTENLDSLKTRRLIFQYPDGTYPAQTSVPFISDAQGTFGFSNMTVDASGNVVIIGNLQVEGVAGPPTGEANFLVGPQPTIIGSSLPAGVNPTKLFLQPNGGQVVMGGGYGPTSSALLDVFGSANIRGTLTTTAGNFTVDSSGNVYIAGSVSLGTPLDVPFLGRNLIGDISYNAASITGTVSGSKIVGGDICGNLVLGNIRGNAISITGDVSGNKVKGDICGNAISISGDICGNQVIGDICGNAFSIIGTIEGDQITSDILKGAKYLTDPLPASQLQPFTTVPETVIVPTTTLVGQITRPPIGLPNVTVDAGLLFGQVPQSVDVYGSSIIFDISAQQIKGPLTQATIEGLRITGDISGSLVVGPLGSSATIQGLSVVGIIDASQIQGNFSTSGVSIPGAIITDISGSKISGTLSSTARIGGSQISGTGSLVLDRLAAGDLPLGVTIRGNQIKANTDISGALILGGLPRAFIPGPNITDDISGNQIVGAMPRAFFSAANITGTIDGGNISGRLTTPASINGQIIEIQTLNGNALALNTFIDPSTNIDGSSIRSGFVVATCISGSLVNATLPGINITGDISGGQIMGSLVGPRVQINGNAVTDFTLKGSSLIEDTEIDASCNISGYSIQRDFVTASCISGSLIHVTLDGQYITGDICGGQIIGDISGSRVRVNGNTITDYSLKGSALTNGTTIDPSVKISGNSIINGQVDATLIYGSLNNATLNGVNVTGDISGEQIVGDISGSRISVNGNTIEPATLDGNAFKDGTDINPLVHIDGGSIADDTLLGIAFKNPTSIPSYVTITGSSINTGSLPGDRLAPGTNISNVVIEGASIRVGTLAGSALASNTPIANVQIDGASITPDTVDGAAIRVNTTINSAVNISGNSITSGSVAAARVSGTLSGASIDVNSVTHPSSGPISFNASGIASVSPPIGVYALYAVGDIASTGSADQKYSLFTTAYYGAPGVGASNYWFIRPVTNNFGTVVTLSATTDFLNLQVTPAGILKKIFYSLISNVQFPIV